MKARSSEIMLTFAGETAPLAAWCARLGLARHTTWSRIKRGWTVEDALTLPSDRGQNRVTFDFNELLQRTPVAFRVLPATRADCPEVRPCPFVTCRYNLATEAVDKQRYRLRVLAPGAESCTLDVAARGGATEEEVADALGLKRQHVHALEAKALVKIEKAYRRMGMNQ